MIQAPCTFTFRASKIMFPDVFKPRQKADSNAGGVTYGITVPVADLPQEVAEFIPDQVRVSMNNGFQTIALRSGLPVPVFDHTLDQTDLRAVWEFAQMTNIGMDAMIRGVPADIAGELYQRRGVSRDGNRDQFGIALRAIRIDFAKVPMPVWGDFHAD